MKREDRLSAGMTPQKVSEVTAILRARFEESRKKMQKTEAQRQSVIPTGEKR